MHSFRFKGQQPTLLGVIQSDDGMIQTVRTDSKDSSLKIVRCFGVTRIRGARAGDKVSLTYKVIPSVNGITGAWTGVRIR